MKKVALIPLRKGSKGIPGKNKKKLLGRPLFCWTLEAALFSEVDLVYIFTDDDEILNFIDKEYHWTSKVKGLLRSESNANDTASTESAMVEFSEKIDYDFDVLCLLQATSPLTTSRDINNVLEKLEEGNDSALTVVKTHRFTWNANGKPQNYDFFNRPRRQDFEGLLIENGAVYATTKTSFKNTTTRISGSIATVEMDEATLTEIDSLTDWKIVENLLAAKLKANRKPQSLKYLILDVDGVFTDGCVYFGAEGELMKKFDMRDGMGLEIVRQYGIEVVVMTSERSALVEKRMQKLQIKHVFMGVKDKHSCLRNFINSKNLTWSNLAYIGDDVNDLANICHVGWSLTPQNATQEIKQFADIILNHDSANGAIREACDWIINYNARFL